MQSKHDEFLVESDCDSTQVIYSMEDRQGGPGEHGENGSQVEYKGQVSYSAATLI